MAVFFDVRFDGRADQPAPARYHNDLLLCFGSISCIVRVRTIRSNSSVRLLLVVLVVVAAIIVIIVGHGFVVVANPKMR